MARKGRAPLRALIDLVRELCPDVDAELEIQSGRVTVGGVPRTNPHSRVRADASVAVRVEGEDTLRGEEKLAAAFRTFEVPLEGRIALDLGAAAGGFTRILLRHGVRTVYAVDAGYGQLIGSLRQHPAVINLERTNLADLNCQLVPASIEIVTADLSYISLTRAIPQLNDRVKLAPAAHLVALIKPQFELGLSKPPTRMAGLAKAVDAAQIGVEQAGWTIQGTAESPVRGSRGAVEFLLHASRRGS